jgi:ribosomal subunit interface protein
MELEIRREDVRLDNRLRQHIERRVGFALGQFGNKVSRVTVQLADINGPRGGVDKQCRLLVRLRDGNFLKIEDLDEDVSAAVSRAADRVGHAVARHFERRRDHQRNPYRPEA